MCTTNGKTKRKKKKRDYVEFIFLYCNFDIQQITVQTLESDKKNWCGDTNGHTNNVERSSVTRC